MVQELVHADADAQLWDEYKWDELIRYIEDGEVIPIIGPDLLRVEHEGKEVLLDRYIASRLAVKLRLSPDLLPAEPSLNQVVCQWVHDKNEVHGLYGIVKEILSQAAFSPPRPLLRLAEIDDFNLFVTTNFDSLLEEAIDSVRFGGRRETVSVAYSREEVKDLEDHDENPQRPTVYHLLGIPSSLFASYVISEEDLLEFICALHKEEYRPHRLFDELKKKHLLILGGNFSDWLARFFLRMAKQHPLSGSRAGLEILADNRTQHDTSLVLFLQHFSSRTRVFRGGGAVEFVDQLWRRWRERHPPSSKPEPPIIPPKPQMPNGAVFISYAKEDLVPVQKLKAGLEAAGLEVWFDKDRLHLGDKYGPKIEKNIRNCSCFVAVLSHTTEQRKEAYFRKEWHSAVDRSTRIDSGTSFLLPVIVDDTLEFERVPQEFFQSTRMRVPGGRVTAEFVEEVRIVVNEFLARKQAK